MNEKDLLEQAKKASKKAYCPYSNFPVGACVLWESGKTYTGCNVENSSYGVSLCAERNAISNSIAKGEKGRIKAIAVYSPSRVKCWPCGACRQWFCEFEPVEDFKLILEDENKEPVTYSFNEIMPNGFRL